MSTALERLPDAATQRGMTAAQWWTLKHSLYPGAKDASIVLVLDYCKARGLDPLKKPCHIVPFEVKVGNTYEWRDVVLPGIYELRTTAQRTGAYLGHDQPALGPISDFHGIRAPEYVDFCVYRWNALAQLKVAFPVRTYFKEYVATKQNGAANARWAKAPIQMLTKCAEAAALRAAFPDELGGEHAAEEMEGQVAPRESTVPIRPMPDPPLGFADFMQGLTDGAELDVKAFAAAWKSGTPEQRAYLVVADPTMYDQLKAHAMRPPEAPVEEAARVTPYLELTKEQRTPEWHAARCGKLTGTSAADLLATLKGGGEPAARRDLRLRLVCEQLTGWPTDDGSGYVNAEMKWGLEWEGAARAAYEARTGSLVESVGFLAHPELAAGCSPDGLVDDGAGLVEIKCPKSATHLRYWRTAGAPAEYVPQMRHNAWITCVPWVDFVSFDPRFPPALQLFVVRVVITQAERASYELLVRRFLDEVAHEAREVQQLVEVAV